MNKTEHVQLSEQARGVSTHKRDSGEDREPGSGDTEGTQGAEEDAKMSGAGKPFPKREMFHGNCRGILGSLQETGRRLCPGV